MWARTGQRPAVPVPGAGRRGRGGGSDPWPRGRMSVCVSWAEPYTWSLSPAWRGRWGMLPQNGVGGPGEGLVALGTDARCHWV